MCLNIFALHSHPTYRLIIAANRDEFYGRKTEAAHFWNGHPGLLAGKDLEAGGTWLGITKNGRFAFITNYRDPKTLKKNAPSRGTLVSDFLTSLQSPVDYLGSIQNIKDYNGFNLVVGDLAETCYLSNISGPVQQLKPGLYGLSNAFLDTPWEKIIRAKNAVSRVISNTIIDPEDLFDVLLNDEKTADTDLPSTGVPYKIEKLVSSMFIRSEAYGTVCSTVVLIDRNNKVTFCERTQNPLMENKTVSYEFVIG